MLDRKDETPPRVATAMAPMPLIAATTEDVVPDELRAELLDRLMHAAEARFTVSISPAGLMLAFLDWAVHLANAPGKQAVLVEKAARKWMRLLLYLWHSARDEDHRPCIEPLPQDHRFDADGWRQQPFATIYQAFLLQQQWWHTAVTGLRGVSERTSGSSLSPCGRCSTWYHRRISWRPIPKYCGARSPRAVRTSCVARSTFSRIGNARSRVADRSGRRPSWSATTSR